MENIALHFLLILVHDPNQKAPARTKHIHASCYIADKKGMPECILRGLVKQETQCKLSLPGKQNTILLCCHGCLEITIAAMTASYTYTQLNNYCTSSST